MKEDGGGWRLTGQLVTGAEPLRPLHCDDAARHADHARLQVWKRGKMLSGRFKNRKVEGEARVRTSRPLSLLFNSIRRLNKEAFGSISHS